jgi:hypothetical protein
MSTSFAELQQRRPPAVVTKQESSHVRHICAADSCIPAGTRLVAGACVAFSAPFRERPDVLARLGDAAFREAIALGPTPSDQCCADLKAFAEGVRCLC